MNSVPPFVEQERPDSCAIACLRMILAQQGELISEAEIVELTDLKDGGLTPAEVSRLARRLGLSAIEQQVDQTELLELIDGGRNPIGFLFRGPLDGVHMTHAVIPF